MIVVHHLNNSRSQRVLWLLEELGLEYQIKFYARDLQTMLAPPALRAIHPLGKSPVVTDGERTLAESGAIIEYLVRRYGDGRLIPLEGTPERLAYTYWLHYAEGSAMPPLLLRLIFSRLSKSPMPWLMRPLGGAIARGVERKFIGPQIKLHLDFMEGELGKHTWFASDEFTAADIQMSFPIEAARARGGLDEARPRLMRYLERIHERAGYQQALERGGPYGLLE